MNSKIIKVLLIEDNPGDTRLLREMLKEATDSLFEVEAADRLASGLDYLKSNPVDAVILDLGLPDSQGLDSFREIYRQSPKVPVLVMTGLADETIGMQAVQEGAQDYLLKGTVEGKLLARIIRFAIERKQILDERDSLITRLKEALSEIRTLSGFLPICAWCKKIRDDKGYWTQVEAYVTAHTDTVFSHGICPECEKKVYKEFVEDNKKGQSEE